MRALLLAGVAGLALGCAAPGSSAGEEASDDPDSVEPTEPAAETAPAATIVVVDAEGAPVADASVVLIDQGYTERLGTASHPLRADRGVITVAQPIAEERIVLAWAPGRAAARVELAAVTGEHRVALGAPTPLLGRVQPRAAADGAPIAHVWLQASDPDAPWPYFVRCDVDAGGRFRANGLAAGAFTVSSVPIGGAPVLAADVSGEVRFLAADPGPVAAVGHRLVDRGIVADGREHVLRAAFGDASVRGRVVDEAHAPIAGADVRILDERGREVRATTDANGTFSVAVAPAPSVHVMASHPDYGAQWTDFEWTGWSYNDVIPEQPIELVLRRGVVLTGRVLGTDGRPFANERLLLVHAYRGSGPRPEETRTDAEGRFTFERMVLHGFELVPESLRNWHAVEPGRYLRVASPDPERWLGAARTDGAIELALEAFERVPVTVEVPPEIAQLEVWMRWGPEQYEGSAPHARAGRVQLTMERGAAHELWVAPFREGQPLTAPWGRGDAPDWSGTPEGPLRIEITPR